MGRMDVFSRVESEVWIYSRHMPVVFSHALNDLRVDESGREYIDFLSGSGAINYGHNNPRLKRALVKYLETDSIMHSLDMATVAKRRFLERFEEIILKPRGLRYKVQPTGPTGANAVKAALKLVRKVSQRSSLERLIWRRRTSRLCCATRWRRLRCVPERAIDRGKPLLELGMDSLAVIELHSLNAARMFAKVRVGLEVEMPTRSLFETARCRDRKDDLKSCPGCWRKVEGSA
jgi:hypothetical protein